MVTHGKARPNFRTMLDPRFLPAHFAGEELRRGFSLSRRLGGYQSVCLNRNKRAAATEYLCLPAVIS